MIGYLIAGALISTGFLALGLYLGWQAAYATRNETPPQVIPTASRGRSFVLDAAPAEPVPDPGDSDILSL